MNGKTIDHLRYTAAQPLRWLSNVFNVLSDISTTLSDKIDIPDKKNEEDLLRTAYHEAGHAVISAVLPHSPFPDYISIAKSGKYAGQTAYSETPENRNHRQSYIEKIAMLYGGMIAEEKKFGMHRPGVIEDIEELTKIADRMVDKLGMSALPVMDYKPQEKGLHKLFGLSNPYSHLPDAIKLQLHDEKVKILEEAHTLARQTLDQHWDGVETVAQAAISSHGEKKNLEGKEILSIMKKLYPDAAINAPLQEL